jgi:hypothetical protein
MGLGGGQSLEEIAPNNAAGALFTVLIVSSGKEFPCLT